MAHSRMHNPAHPGIVLKTAYMDALGITITDLARAMDIGDRKRLSRLIHGHTPMTIDMAIRLSIALDTTPDFWLNMQASYDLFHAKVDTRNIRRVETIPA